MPIDELFTHLKFYRSSDLPPALYWQGGASSIYFAKGNVFDYEYYGFDGLIVQYRPALSCMNACCGSLIARNDAEGLPEIPMLVIGFDTCMLFIDPNKDPESKALINRYPEVFRELGRKGNLRRYVIDSQDTHRAQYNNPFAPSNEQISVLVNELLSTLDRQGCKHIGFHGIYNRYCEDSEHETVRSVREWLELNSRKGIRVTMVDGGDSYNNKLNPK